MTDLRAAATAIAATAGTALSPYVFPGGHGRPITDLKRTWLSVCRTAGLVKQTEKRAPDGSVVKAETGDPVMVWRATARIHDLRHTYASILASHGLSLPIIGALLGHTQPQTTARYAHLLDDPLRAATEHVGARVSGNAADRITVNERDHAEPDRSPR